MRTLSAALLSLVTLLTAFTCHAAPAVEVIVRLEHPVSAYAVEGDEIYWASDASLYGARIGTSTSQQLAALDPSRRVTTVLIHGDEVLVGALGANGRSLHAIPRTGGDPRLVSGTGGPDVVRSGDATRWMESKDARTSVVAGLDPTGARAQLGGDIEGIARTLAFDGDATWFAIHTAAGTEGRLVHRDAAGASRVVYTSDATLLVVASDASGVYLLERRAGLGRLVSVDKRKSSAKRLFEAHYPGEFVLGARVALDARRAYVAELVTTGDSDSGAIWRVPLDGRAPTVWTRRTQVVQQPSIAGAWLYFVEIDKRTGASAIVRSRL